MERRGSAGGPQVSRLGAGWLVVLVACGPPVPEPTPGGGSSLPGARPGTPPAAPPAAVVEAWAPPPPDAFPAGPLGESVRRGLDLFTHTTERLPAYAPGNINCSNCHLDAGRKLGSAALVGAHARFPKYMDRTGSVIPLHDRVNYCFTRSLAGGRLPVESRQMSDLLAYIAWLSVDVPDGGQVPGVAMPKMPPLTGDPARGATLYAEKCAVCHGDDGAGKAPGFPAVWGSRSYSIGASMAREERAASFIRQFMPQTAPGTLTDQEAYDLAAYINSHERPDSPGKENDWPNGDAPADVPYATAQHVAFRAPPGLVPRSNPEASVVAPPVVLPGAP